MPSTPPDSEAWRFPNRATPIGSPNYYAVRFSPESQRDRNAGLIAWYELVQGIADRPLDPGVARLKLDWWRDELERLGARQARHPLALALQDYLPDPRVLQPMQAILEAAEADVRAPQPLDDLAFGQACRNSFGQFFVLLAALEPAAYFDRQRCIEAGGYCAAVERIRRLTEAPHRVPADLAPRSLGRLDAARRRVRLQRLFDQFVALGPNHGARNPPFADRLLALASATHKKMRCKGYPVTDRLIERAPVAHLWTAWRCC